ncbi:uncharacterized protein ACNLHF_003094 [Anomaloglossus baeobatrachus]
MKNLVALLCIISALVGSVFSYKCFSCFSPNSTTCNQSESECLGDRCMTASQYTFNGEVEFKSLIKACANETLCGIKGAIARENVKFRFFVHCCTGNLCNTDKYELQEEDPKPNGKKCPSAYCTNTLEDCKSDKEVNCTGSMDRCFDYRAEVINPGLFFSS